MHDKAHKKEKEGITREHAACFLEMAFSWERRGTIENPDGYGKRTGMCGDTIEIYLAIENDRIQKALFNINGCLNTSACANTVTHFAEGAPVDEAWKIDPQKVADYLQTLPSDHAHCAELAVGAFYLALADYQRKQKGDSADPEGIHDQTVH